MRRWRCCNRGRTTAILTIAGITTRTNGPFTRQLAGWLRQNERQYRGEHAVCAAVRCGYSGGPIRTGGYGSSRAEHYPQSDAERWNGLSTRCGCGGLSTRAENGTKRLGLWILTAADARLGVAVNWARTVGYGTAKIFNVWVATWCCSSHLLD